MKRLTVTLSFFTMNTSDKMQTAPPTIDIHPTTFVPVCGTARLSVQIPNPNSKNGVMIIVPQTHSCNQNVTTDWKKYLQ